MQDALLTDAPECDRDEIAAYIESHGGAIVLRVGDKIGSDAHEAFVAYKKENDYADPPHDFVWIGGATLGWDTSAAAVDGAELLGHHEAVGERQGRQPAQELRRLRVQMRLHFWWGGVMFGAGCAFALKHGRWPSWAALIAFGLLFTIQNWRSL